MKKLNKLYSFKGQSIASLSTVRQVKFLKAYNDVVFKRVEYSGIGIGWNYANSLMKRAGQDVKHKPVWFNWINYPVILENKDTKKEFLRFYILHNKKSKIDTYYYANGKTIKFEKIKDKVLSSERNHLKQGIKDSQDKQNIDNPIMPVNISMNDIVQLKMGKISYSR